MVQNYLDIESFPLLPFGELLQLLILNSPPVSIGALQKQSVLTGLLQSLPIVSQHHELAHGPLSS